VDLSQAQKAHFMVLEHIEFKKPIAGKLLSVQTVNAKGAVFGLRKFDHIKSEKGICIIRVKRSSGYFTLCDVFGKMITISVTIMRNCTRLRRAVQS